MYYTSSSLILVPAIAVTELAKSFWKGVRHPEKPQNNYLLKKQTDTLRVHSRCPLLSTNISSNLNFPTDICYCCFKILHATVSATMLKASFFLSAKCLICTWLFVFPVSGVHLTDLQFSVCGLVWGFFWEVFFVWLVLVFGLVFFVPLPPSPKIVMNSKMTGYWGPAWDTASFHRLCH